MADTIDQLRAGITDRVELPGMTLMEHLDELRKRLIHAILWLVAGIAVTAVFISRLINIIQKPLTEVGLKMTMTHPTDAIELDIKTAVVFGAIVASPFILYQLWLFISPGLYDNEKKYVFPLHVLDHRPLPRRSLVRLSLGSARRHQGSHPRLRQKLHPHDHDR